MCGDIGSETRWNLKLDDNESSVFPKLMALGSGASVKIDGGLQELLSLGLMADRYQVEVVQCSVEDAVLTLLTLETCGSILVSSFGSGLTRVQSESREFALRKFDDFSKSPGFMEIDEEVLGSLLDDDGLTTEKEERVFEAVVRWMKSDGELRGKELLRKIRFPHMDALYLADITSSQVLDDVGLDGLLLDSSVLKSIPRHLWAGRRLRFLDPKVLVPRGKVRWEDFARGGERRLAVRGHVHSVAVHGGYVCGGLLDGTILIWSRSTMDHERTLVGHSKTVWALLSTGGWLVSGGSDHTVRVWDVAAGRCEGVLEGHTGIVTCLAADGARLMSGSLDGTVRVWRAEGVAPAWRCEHLLDALGDQLGGLVAGGGGRRGHPSVGCGDGAVGTDAARARGPRVGAGSGWSAASQLLPRQDGTGVVHGDVRLPARRGGLPGRIAAVYLPAGRRRADPYRRVQQLPPPAGRGVRGARVGPGGAAAAARDPAAGGSAGVRGGERRGAGVGGDWEGAGCVGQPLLRGLERRSCAGDEPLAYCCRLAVRAQWRAAGIAS